MPKSEQHAYSHYVLAVLLGIVGLLIILIFVSLRSQADDTTTTATITNATATIDSITVSTVQGTGGAAVATVTTAENTSMNIYVHGTFTDNNSCQEVATSTGSGYILVQLERTNQGTCDYQSDAGSNNYVSCIVWQASANSSVNDANASTTFSSCDSATDPTGSFDTRFPLFWNIDETEVGQHVATDWTGTAVAHDGTTYGTTSSGDTFEVDERKALDVTAAIDFGSLSVGSTSSAQTVTVTHTGNSDTQDAQIEGTNLTCSTGTLWYDLMRYSSTSGDAWSVYQQVASSAADQNLQMSKAAVTTSASTDSSFIKLEVPTPTSSIFAGTCAGTLTFTAN